MFRDRYILKSEPALIALSNMNRRLFLSTVLPKVPATEPFLKIRPARMKASEDTVAFVSENGGLQLTKRFVDRGSSVATIEDVEWKDPVTNRILKKHIVEVYILDSSEV